LKGREEHVLGRAHQNRERGGSKLNLIVTLLILGAMVFSAVKVVPAYFANYQFQDAIESEARFAISNRKAADDIRDDIWRKAQDLSIPLEKKEDITVSVDRASVSIATDYSVPVDLLLYQFKLDFHPHADNHTI
jgi:Domain of unknown function (DUF4845)